MKSLQRIIIICEAIGGGVRKHLLDVLDNLDKNKFELSLIYSSSRADTVFKSRIEDLKQSGIKLYDLPKMQREISISKDTASLLDIFKIAKKIKPDIIHCHSSKAGVLGRIVGRILGIKVIYTPHAYFAQNNSLNTTKKNVYVCIERVLGYITFKTVNVSQGENEFALNHKIVRKNNSVVIYNGIADIEDLPAKSSLKNPITIGTLSRVDFQKNPWLFIEIAETLIKKYDNINFLYVGDGILLEKMQKYIKEKNLEKRINFSGFSSEIVKELNKFDIYLSTALYEGLPYSVIEALALKKPLVLSDVTGNNELVVPGYNGELFELESPNEAIRKIENILNNSSLYESYSKNSYQLFKKKFSLKQMIIDLESLYFSVK